ncbi:endonuclease/exonuclease/phosphatase family protein [Actinokineospora sp. PR83]|uniref:endonuclease/exonuclease/phosphatase family protein n=1 Tax=Actinokineospora sp. PR83 TaxID=2884908 RepID=UPI0027E1E4CF|nr:endonuclease/exonuclease/phosphatase family protein [Actinokineospora sp. PR83]MCG8918164.1 endonuclease/exonuclease/phosphatase family protein [Actinokineospora sp. PR83]
MRALLITLLALLAATPAAGTPAEPAHRPVALRVLSFNTHTGIGADGRLDLDRVAATIRAARPDVVGLQEVDVHWSERSGFADQARELACRTGLRVFFAPIYDEPGTPRRRYGVAVLSALPVLRTENHEITRLSTQDPTLPPTPMPGFAEVVVLTRGGPVHVYSTHLDYRPDPSVRAAQVADTLRVLARAHGPKVLLGDLNAEPEAPELAPLWTALRSAPTGPTYPADAPTKKIDHVAVSPGVRVTSATVVDSAASDHRPVLADLVLGPGREAGRSPGYQRVSG